MQRCVEYLQRSLCIYVPIICWVLWVISPCALSFRPPIRLEFWGNPVFWGFKLAFLFVRSCALSPSFRPPLPSLGCHSYDDHGTAQEVGKGKNVVNLGAIRQGMKRFQFLLNCCEPGTIPDASILAAALDLVSSHNVEINWRPGRMTTESLNIGWVLRNWPILKPSMPILSEFVSPLCSVKGIWLDFLL